MGIAVDHTTIHHWTVRFSPLLLERFSRRKRTVTGKGHVEETYIKVRGRWMELYSAIESVDDTVEFFCSLRGNLIAFRKMVPIIRKYDAVSDVLRILHFFAWLHHRLPRSGLGHGGRVSPSDGPGFGWR